MSLRTLFLLLALALGILPMAGLTLVNLPEAYQRLVSSAQRQSLAELEGRVAAVNRRLARYRETARVLALLPAPREMVLGASAGLQLDPLAAKKRFGNLMLRWFRDMGDVQAIHVTHLDGNIELTAARMEGGALELAFDGALEATEAPARLRREADGGTSLLLTEYIQHQGETIGQTVLVLDLQRVLTGYEDAIWLTPEGRQLNRGEQLPMAQPVEEMFPTLGQVLAGNSADTTKAGSSGRRFAWMPLHPGTGQRPLLWLGTEVDLNDAEQWLQGFQFQFMSTVAVLVVFVGLFARFLATRGERIKQQLATGLARILDAEESVEFPWRHPRELRQLAAELQLLARRHAGAERARSDAERALEAEKERAEITLHAINDGVLTTDLDGIIDYLNPAAGRIFGMDPEDLYGRPLQQVLWLMDEESGEPLPDPTVEALRTRSLVEPAAQALLRNARDEEVAIEACAAPRHAEGTTLSGAVLVLRDVSQQRTLQRQLTYQANHDSLTGLYNRRRLERELHEALDDVRADSKRRHWLCYLDMDQFKIINDTCGHLAGDEMLKQVASLLHETLPRGDFLARLGGDEFALVLYQRDSTAADEITEAVRDRLASTRFLWDKRAYGMSASIGVVPIDANSGSLQQILSDADTACLVAKEAGRNRVHRYREDDTSVRQRAMEMEWVQRLRRAVEEDRFVLHFQPIVPVRGDNGELHGEVLLRMLGEDGELIPPMAFIPAAERYNLMANIDRWVFDTTIATLAEAEAKGQRLPTTVSINLSAPSLGDDDLLEHFDGVLAHGPVAPERICFEITETAAIGNLARAQAFLHRLNERGCRFSLDDFGSGLSSFGYLKHLPVDYLKIDGSFVRDIVDDPMNLELVKSINQIGHVLGARTIAEFVENDAIWRQLRRIGVDYAQGYAIDKPAPLSDWLEGARAVRY